MDGWMNGSMFDGWTDRWMKEWVYGWGALTLESMDRQRYRWMNDRWREGGRDKWTDVRTERFMVGWEDGQMDECRMDRRTD